MILSLSSDTRGCFLHGLLGLLGSLGGLCRLGGGGSGLLGGGPLGLLRLLGSTVSEKLKIVELVH